jgi:CRP-like cAMP-binding protein
MPSQAQISHAAQILQSRAGRDVTIRAVPRGQIIFRDGEPATWALLLQEGFVQLSIGSPDGKVGIVGIMGAGDFLGESCVSSDPVRFVTATALADCRFLQVQRDVFAQILATDRLFMEELISFELAQRRRSVELLGHFLFHSSEQRLGRMLILLDEACRRGEVARSTGSDATPKISHQSLADMVGTTRPRVTYFMSKFRQAGLLEANGSLTSRSKMLKYLEGTAMEELAPPAYQNHGDEEQGSRP